MDYLQTLKVAICDDNPQERQFFLSLCVSIKNKFGTHIKLKQYETGESLLFDMEDTKICSSVDIILLDINMPGKNGIFTAERLREYGYNGAIIFVTASDEHWRNAFRVKAFNYITKGRDVESRFEDVFMGAAREAWSRRGKTLLFSSVGETRMVEVASISHFEINQHLVKVYYDKDKTFEFMSSLSKIQDMLLDESFVRVHRAYLASVSKIAELSDNCIIMQNGKQVPVSRRCIATLKNKLAEKDVLDEAEKQHKTS